jgi:GGDEF domain-containing protein
MRRPYDFAARLGGEEFAAVWFDAKTEDAQRLGEALRQGISALGMPAAPGLGQAVTASAGLVHVPAVQMEDAADSVAVEMMRKADSALYRAKQHGRDQLMLSEAQIDAARVVRPQAPTQEPSAAQVQDRAGMRNPVAYVRAALDKVRFDDAREAEFITGFERQGRSSRAQILIGLLIVVALLLGFQDSVLKIPEEADGLGRLTLCLGLVPAALVALVGCFYSRWHRWSAVLYLVAISVILAAQMLGRIVQLSKGYDVVPLMMPVAVLLSLSVVQIRYRLMMPAMLLNLFGVIAAELWFFEATGNRILEVGTAAFMVIVTLIFAYKVERSARLSWQHERDLEEMACTDGLTGLFNRHHFDTALRQDIRAAVREGKNVALLILDVDYFKDRKSVV